MASTNKTSHYNLSQYVGSDKPTYLTDYNNDMSAIDTGIYNAQTKANTADGKADTADAKAVAAQGDATTALNSAGTANTNIGTMANLTTTEKSSLVGALNEVKSEADTNKTNIEKFNLTTFTTYNKDSSGLTIEGCTISGGSITIAKNSDSSICKVYGTLTLNKTAQGGYITIPNTGIMPTEEFNVSPAGIEYDTSNNSVNGTSITFKTDGSVKLNIWGASANHTSRAIFIPFIIFVKNFGDTPSA